MDCTCETYCGHENTPARSALNVSVPAGTVAALETAIAPTHRSVYMVECGTGYRAVPRSSLQMGGLTLGGVADDDLNRGYYLEGVDGDEAANTVTYWYRRREEI